MRATRLKRRGAKETFSISVSAATKKRLKSAARAHGGNVSALIEALVQELDRQSALEWLLQRAQPVEPAAYEEFLAELTSASRRSRRRAA
jgi:hypothetical protein